MLSVTSFNKLCITAPPEYPGKVRPLKSYLLLGNSIGNKGEFRAHPKLVVKADNIGGVNNTRGVYQYQHRQGSECQLTYCFI